MYNTTEALKALFGRVGWFPQRTDPEMTLNATNAKSNSGRYFQNFHSIVTLQNILSTVEDKDMNEAEFNAYLERLQSSAILTGLSGVFRADDVIEQVVLFDRKDRNSLTPINGKKLVGYRIKVAKDTSYSVYLKAVSMMFDADTTVTLECIHSLAGPLWNKEVNTKANQEVVVNIEDLALYYSTDKYKGGYFFIGYDQNKVSAKALDYTCPSWAKTLIFGYDSFEATVDLENVQLTNKTYGLNLELSSYRDFTEIIKRNSTIFDSLIGLQVAAATVEQIISSTRSNKDERITKEQSMQLYNDLNLAHPSQDIPYTTGLKNKIRSEVDRLRKNFLPKLKSETQTPCFTQRGIL